MIGTHKAIVAILLAVSVVPASAAQLDVNILSDATEITPSYKFLRIVFFEYPDGGELADMLQGKDGVVSFLADSKTPGVPQLMSKLNAQLADSLSGAWVDDIKIKYQAILDVDDKSASIEYNIELVPTIKNHAITIDSQTYIDSDWRGIKLSGPIPIETKYGEYDINSPESVLQVLIPELLQEIQNTEAKEILGVELLDASGISALPLEKWHYLFDPTGVLEEAKNAGFKESSVISHYSMGECSIKVGICKDKSWTGEFVLDKKYTIRAIESQDDATISIEGYGNKKTIGLSEVFGIREGIGNDAKPNEEFPVNIIYGMAGMAGIAGIGIFLFSSRKLKKEQNQGQTGIDPAQLEARQTSSSAQGYQTNRGESYLRSKNNQDSETRVLRRKGTLPKELN